MRIVREDTYQLELEEATSKYLTGLRTQIKNLKEERHESGQNQAEYVRNLKHEHELDEQRWRRRTEQLDAQNQALAKDSDSTTQLASKKVELDRRDATLKQSEKWIVDQRKDLDNERELRAQEEDASFKKGYADGLADGIRQGVEFSAEDRNNYGRIAALAAASHSTDASKDIGKAVAESIQSATKALEAGKKAK